MAIYLQCPFCENTGFDLIGLKMHIQRGWCEEFEATPDTFPPAPETQGGKP